MKKIVFLLVTALGLMAVPALIAQDHAEVGVFADYVRLHHADDANFWGLGGRVGFNIMPHVQLEGDIAYDFERNFTTTTSTGGTTTFTQSNGLRLIHGAFGPKFMTNVGPVRAFAVLKGGFLNFGVSGNGPAIGFTNQLSSFGSGDTNGVFYPGGGVEFFAGPIGFRAEAGDLMYFDRGANHNLSITFGPAFRF
ncbi:MAG TPA: hypothetical protein VG897_11630 [Terriglobales bacterium]|nr:hypothetical protein [Terriglobales bacterium]